MYGLIRCYLKMIGITDFELDMVVGWFFPNLLAEKLLQNINVRIHVYTCAAQTCTVLVKMRRSCL